MEGKRMSGKEKTPGQRAYEAWWATAEGVPATPDVTYDQDAEAWEAAATAATAELLGELEGVRAERDRLREQAAKPDDLHITGRIVKERDQARERYADAVIANRDLAIELAAVRNLVAEILDAADPDRGAEDRIAKWRKRAGLPPAFVTAGTEHLVAALAGDGEGA